VKLAVPIRRELRDCLCFNGAYCTVGASNNHSLIVAVREGKLVFQFVRGEVFLLLEVAEPRVGMLLRFA
jgi:hypothetical protein